MKEKMYHVALDENEHGILIRCLNDERTSLLNEGHTTDALDDLIVKVGTARQKKCRVTEKGRTHDAR